MLEAAVGDAVESFELVPGDALDLVLAHIPGTRAPLAGGARLERADRGGGADGRAEPRARANRSAARRRSRPG